MASVHKRNHRERVVYRAVWRETGVGGKPRLRNKSFAKAADARAHAAKMEATVERRGVGDPGRHTTTQYLEQWLASLRDRGEHSPTTLESYARCIALTTPWISNIPLDKLSAAHLDRAYGQMLKAGGKAPCKAPGKARPLAELKAEMAAAHPDHGGTSAAFIAARARYVAARRAAASERRASAGARPLTARTVLNVHRCLHTALEQARKWKLIPENPTRDARAPSPARSKARAFTKDEVQRLLNTASTDPVTYAMVATLLTCGLRRSEMVGLGFDAVDFNAGTLEVKRAVLEVEHRPVIREHTKTRSSARTLKIPPELVALLKGQLTRVQEQMLKWGREYRRDPLLVFPSLAGAPMTPMVLTRKLRILLRRAGIENAQPCHAWRHTAATALLGAGQNVKTVQARLGHSTPAITLALYVHPVDERDAEAAEHFGTLIRRQSLK